jgi:hypothetical protein
MRLAFGREYRLQHVPMKLQIATEFRALLSETTV